MRAPRVGARAARLSNDGGSNLLLRVSRSTIEPTTSRTAPLMTVSASTVLEVLSSPTDVVDAVGVEPRAAVLLGVLSLLLATGRRRTTDAAGATSPARKRSCSWSNCCSVSRCRCELIMCRDRCRDQCRWASTSSKHYEATKQQRPRPRRHSFGCSLSLTPTSTSIINIIDTTHMDGIFYSEFDNIAGPKVTYQEPEGYARAPNLLEPTNDLPISCEIRTHTRTDYWLPRSSIRYQNT